MTTILCLLLFHGLGIWQDGPISKVNALKQKAQVAWEAGRYQEAVNCYTYLIDSLGVDDISLRANRAHAYFSLKDSAQALHEYRYLAYQVNDSSVQSIALNQLGLLSDGKLSDTDAFTT